MDNGRKNNGQDVSLHFFKETLLLENTCLLFFLLPLFVYFLALPSLFILQVLNTCKIWVGVAHSLDIEYNVPTCVYHIPNRELNL